MIEDEMIPTNYQVLSVEKIDAPDGLPGDNWFQYVIGHKKTTIDGIKTGTLKNVTLHAESVAKDLNLRSMSNRSSYAPKQNQNRHKKTETTK